MGLFNLFQDKDFLMNIVSGAMPAGMTGEGLQDLLDGLSHKELKILREHEDLKNRVAKISRMDLTMLTKDVRGHFDLEVTSCRVGTDVWVGFKPGLEDLLPSWFNGPGFGWYLTLQTGEFSEWARNLLMQEVRVNIWMRYLQHKKDAKGTKAVPEDDYTHGFGMYV